MFFTLLGKDRSSWFQARLNQVSEVSGKRFFYSGNNYGSVNTMPVFPNQWVKSCIALNTVSGSFQWVARGVLVENNTYAGITRNVPTDLTGRIILGAVLNSDGTWTTRSNKVTNLNIFSSALSVEKMQEYTGGGQCGEEGDYLSWDQMHWTLYGDAVIEEVDGDEPCEGEPPLNFYPAPFHGMESCMQFCQNLGSRSPSVTDLQQWESLRILLRKKIPREFVWLSIDDTQKEGEWRDYYTQHILNFTLPWFKNEPNGAKSENCALLASWASLRWSDFHCATFAGCLCDRLVPLPRLKLQGLCLSSTLGR